MTPQELAAMLLEADDDSQQGLFTEHAAIGSLPLAYALKDECYRAWSTDPPRAARAANALAMVANATGEPEIRALTAWTAGITELTRGQMEAAIARLDQAEAGFAQLQQPHTAASTQVSKLYALAVLGRYDEALACGARARDVLAAHGDDRAAGRIEQNLANIEFRRGRFPEAEQLYHDAHDRARRIGDADLLILAENGLGNVLTQRHAFDAARQRFERALARSEEQNASVHQAMIECNLGSLALFQGQYDRALNYLNRSRRRYAGLGMPHESAIAELEIADAYLELNLAREAAELYAGALPTFEELGMQAERAHALAHAGRAASFLGQSERAQTLLEQARALYEMEGNAVGAAQVALSQAQFALAQNDAARAAHLADLAEPPLADSGAHGQALMARWLRGEAARQLGRFDQAQTELESTLRAAQASHAPHIAQRCLTSLGLLAASHDPAAAERAFREAIALIEELRAPLPAEEFRVAFVADKLAPYDEMVRLCLADGTPARTVEALQFVERARARALVEMLGGAVSPKLDPKDPAHAEPIKRLETLRAELNWFYSELHRPPDGETTRSAAQRQELDRAIQTREAELAELIRDLEMLEDDAGAPLRVEPFDLNELQARLGEERALVEYFALDGELRAFVVTDEGVRVVSPLAAERVVGAALEQFRFQISALRYGPKRLQSRLPQLVERTRHYLAQLYDLLLAPLEPHLGARHLVVVPHQILHYVPFHALHDGSAYVIERREVSYSPSASVLQRLLRRPRRALRRALLLGLPDEWTPRVRDEVAALKPLFPESITLSDEGATLDALRAALPFADIAHLASHGQFRPDNPLFSSLRLHDGWLTVRDAYALELNCELVTLSACETGLSAIARGDELIGLARGFFRAGAPSLVVSLWTVDDAATAQFMSEFYEQLTAGITPAAALRHAQLRLRRTHEHPYFWSPFVLLGRW